MIINILLFLSIGIKYSYYINDFEFSPIKLDRQIKYLNIYNKFLIVNLKRLSNKKTTEAPLIFRLELEEKLWHFHYKVT